MGIYIFSRRALVEALSNEKHIDFGRHVIPAMLSRMRVQAYVFDGYWEDVGTIRSYYEANLALTQPEPAFNFYDARSPIFTHPRFLAPTKVQDVQGARALIADGCFIEGAEIESSVIGIRSRIGQGVQIRRSLILGADFYETPDEMADAVKAGEPPMGIGEGTHHRRGHHRQERPHRPQRAHPERGPGQGARRQPTTTSARASSSSPRAPSSPTAPSFSKIEPPSTPSRRSPPGTSTASAPASTRCSTGRRGSARTCSACRS